MTATLESRTMSGIGDESALGGRKEKIQGINEVCKSVKCGSE